MKLAIDKERWNEFINHLLPKNSDNEFAAFLFGEAQGNENITVSNQYLIQRSDLLRQGRDHLELAEEVRARLIKKAHDTNTSLIEAHSHPFASDAQFSNYDISNLRETVPHMLWRLRGKPYIAIVVGPHNYDALVWERTAEKVSSLNEICIGTRSLKPTQLSSRLWQ